MKKILLFALLLGSFSIFSQEQFGPTTVIQGTYVGKTIPLRDMPTINERSYDTKELKIIQNNLRANEKVNQDALPISGIDPIRQKTKGGIFSYALEQNFDGLGQGESGGFVPPDPSGAVGPNHYVAASNVAIKIFDKTGNVLAGPIDLGTFLSSGNNDGDPIIMYDQLADRFFVSQFRQSDNAIILGVSETNDPTGSYYVYSFPLDAFPDYPHYSIWHDGYYLTANKFTGNTVYAIERDVILAGGSNPKIVGFNPPGIVSNPNTVFSPEFANLTGTVYPANAPAYLTYLQDDGWGGGITFDHLKVWEVTIDWANTSNSSISSPLEIPVDPFDSVFAPFGSGDLNQPGTSQKIDMIGGVISYAANYRSFGTHNSWVVTFNVDVDGNDTSGIRWIELRNDSANTWSVYQQGTYAPADGLSRFMGSAAMDAAGNIGLAFNVGSSTLPVGIRYTGRFNGDTLGEMTVAETTIIDGVGVQTFSNRFGDYSHLTMDPDNFTFWHTAEYFTANNNWSTRVASFTLSGGFANDVGINAINTPNNGILTNAETVEVSIRNYGTDPQTNIPIELRVDGSLVATETFIGTLNQNDVATFTFAQPVDLSTPGQTYSIEAKTILTTDEFNPNDSFTKEVTNIFANDIGVTQITSPVSGEGLGSETITVVLENFGAVDQTNFDVSYTINGTTTVTENVAGPLTAGGIMTYSFIQPGDFSAIGTYTISSSTLLAGDADPSNDTATATVVNVSCFSQINDTDYPIGPSNGTITSSIINFTDDFVIDDANVTVNLNHTYMGDLEIKLVSPTGIEVVLFDRHGGSGNNLLNTTFDDEATTPIADGNPPYGGSFQPDEMLSNFDGMQTAGDWTLVITDFANGDSGTLLDWTLQLCGDPNLGIEDITINQSELLVLTKENNTFDVILISSYEGDAFVGVYNVLGQQIGVKLISKEGDRFKLHLDMSSMASGVYLIRMGSLESGAFKTTRIIVK